MSTGRILAYIGAAILIFFGVLFIWSAFGRTGHPANILIGLITLGVGFLLIWFAGRQAKREETELIQRIELSGDIDLESLTCRNCGGALTADNIKMVAGAPVVNCPYCGTSYQLTEEPKW